MASTRQPLLLVFIILALSFAPGTARAQQDAYVPEDKFISTEQAADSVEESKGFVPLPLLYYTPDTRLAFGVVGVYYFKLQSDIPGAKPTRLSYTQLLVDYTLNRQFDVWGLWNVFLREENYISKGEFRYRIYSDRFYGIGNNTPDMAMERYRYDYISIKKLMLRKIKPGMFVGGDYQFTYLYNLQLNPEGQLASGNITGSGGGINSGLGTVFLIDTRDNIVNASKGVLLEASSYFYGKAIGSDFAFTNLNLTYNRYFELKPRHILATNMVMNLNFGDPPFINLATAGGDQMLRGYPAYRYRDQHFTGMQAEYRFPLFWRLGMATFAGVGDVYKKPSEVRLSTIKYSYGAGLRFALNKKENLNIRLDYGIGRNSSSFYFTVTEAF
jgi:outer membrane protein assembly factor BamA